jgi:hypothetical protein
MEREEIEAMWERIKALEENSLKVSKALANQSIYSILGVMSSKVVGGSHKTFQAYMTPKAIETLGKIENAQNVDEIIGIIEQFTGDCTKFTTALLK